MLFFPPRIESFFSRRIVFEEQFKKNVSRIFLEEYSLYDTPINQFP